MVAKRLEWWSDARFGMFIHWGLYAQDGCFWKGQDGLSEHMMRNLQIPIAEYEKIADEFNPVKFNADEWAKAAEQLDQTAVTQPALFVLSYALAQLWMSWGVIDPMAALPWCFMKDFSTYLLYL